MLNVYDKIDKPDELDGYEEKYPLLVALNQLKDNPGELSSEDKNVLSRNISVVKKNPKAAYLYAKVVMYDRWPEAEPVIKKSPEWAGNYAKFIMRGRFEEAEPYIMKDPFMTYWYVKEILAEDNAWTKIKGHENGRWPEAESYMMINPQWAIAYARDIIQGRWEEAEPYIKKNQHMWDQYKKVFGIEE